MPLSLDLVAPPFPQEQTQEQRGDEVTGIPKTHGCAAEEESAPLLPSRPRTFRVPATFQQVDRGGAEEPLLWQAGPRPSTSFSSASLHVTSSSGVTCLHAGVDQGWGPGWGVSEIMYVNSKKVKKYSWPLCEVRAIYKEFSPKYMKSSCATGQGGADCGGRGREEPDSLPLRPGPLEGKALA